MNKQAIKKRFFRILNLFGHNKYKKVVVKNNGSILKRCKIWSNGENNTLFFSPCGTFNNLTVKIYGNNNIIRFGDKIVSNSTFIQIEDNGNEISIGANTVLSGSINIGCIEGTKVIIGKDCLFSSEITIRTGDSHSILDCSGTRINRSKDVVIGNHVWVGHKVTINKGASISDNSIVGAGTIVTKSFNEPNICVAGNPGSIIKRNINWDAKRL